MPISIGNTEITQLGKIMVGNQQVQRVYVGNQQVWPQNVLSIFDYSLTMGNIPGATLSIIVRGPSNQIAWSDSIGPNSFKSGLIPSNVMDLVFNEGHHFQYRVQGQGVAGQLFLNGVFVMTKNPTASANSIGYTLWRDNPAPHQLLFQ